MRGAVAITGFICWSCVGCDDAPPTPPPSSPPTTDEVRPPRPPPAPETADREPDAGSADATAVVASPPPPVHAPIPVDEDDVPAVVPELREAPRIGEGPWLAELDFAVGAGWVDFAADEPLEIVVDVERPRENVVLATGPSRIAPAPHSHIVTPLVSVWLARVQRREDEDGVPEFRRTGALRLYDGAARSEPPLDLDSFSCSAADELRVRDVDGDGETEATVISAYYQPTHERWGGGGTPMECGAVAFIVGLDDWNLQASFTREYAVTALAASIEVGESRVTTWQLRDVDGDGHTDLRVVERWRFQDDFMGDYVGGGETMGPSRTRGSDQREVGCAYVPSLDVFRCDASPPPGQLLFGDPRTRAETRGRRPW